MNDREFEAAIRDLTSLTIEDDMKWVRRANGSALESDDVAGFLVKLAATEDDLELTIEDKTGVVAHVGPNDERDPAERAALEGAAYTLWKLAKRSAGTEAAADWAKAVSSRRRQSD